MTDKSDKTVSRRTILGGAAAAIAMPSVHFGSVARAQTTRSENAEARSYYRLLLKHTRWVETLWDEAVGHYPIRDFYFVNVLGNAVVLNFGSFDAELAGIDADTLRDHTVRTIDHAAATNFYATGAEWGEGGYEWGGRIYWDSTLETYFVAAAKLMWDDLSQETRDNVDALGIGAAEFVAGLELTEDPRSGGRTNGLAGGYIADSKIEEMGAKSMPLAVGLAHYPDHPSAPKWREWLTRWTLNMTGLPATDEHDDTVVEGHPVSWWNEAQNVYPTFIVENHNSYAPIYQESVGAYPGRNAAQFLIGGQPLPDVFGYQPNDAELWRTLRHLGARAGLSSHPMVADRYHLYGRDVLPLTWGRLGRNDPYLARSERLLIDHLEPYLNYPPVGMLTKFSGEPKYEPEARAEVAMAYLLHLWRDELHGDVDPAGTEEYWADVTGVVDYGADVGLAGHQTPNGLAMAVSKAGFTKFAFVPEHDDWLLDVSGKQPGFVPSPAAVVQARDLNVYTEKDDGFDASATVLTLETGFVGFVTLPTGAVVYATSGVADGEGALRLHALDMPGVPGLDGSRTFHGPDGAVTLEPDGATREFPTGWVNVDNRAGFVVRGSSNPIRVAATSLALSSGPAAGAAGMIVEGYPRQRSFVTAQLAKRAAPVVEGDGLVAGLVDGYLAVFNLSADNATGVVHLSGETVEVMLPAASASVLRPG